MVTNLKMDGTIGTGDNVHADQLKKTGDQYSKNAEDYADRTRESAKETALAKQKLIDKRDAGKKTRADDLQKKSDEIEKKAEEQSKLRSEEAADITAMQDQIASRQANVNVANAGASGLVLSSGAIQGHMDDALATYGDNIKSAKQFELQTNMTLDKALEATGITAFNNQKAINIMKGVLDDARMAPMLEALDKAAKGDQKAIDDVYSFYQESLRAIKEGQQMRAEITEKDKANEEQWANSTLDEKLAQINAIAKTPGFNKISDQLLKILNDNPNMSRAAMFAKITTLAQNNLDATEMRKLAMNPDLLKAFPEFKTLALGEAEGQEGVTNTDSDKLNHTSKKKITDSTGTQTDVIKGGSLPISNYKGYSIIDYLNLQGLDSSSANRIKLAEEYGVDGYHTGPNNGQVNLTLLNAMRDSEGKVKEIVKPKEYNVVGLDGKERTYTESEAKRVIAATKDLMKRLDKKYSGQELIDNRKKLRDLINQLR